MFERRLVFHVDWLLIGALLMIVGIGIAMIYSTTYVIVGDGGHAGPQVQTQVYALVLGLIALAICLAIDYRVLAENSLVIFGGLIASVGQRMLGGVSKMMADKFFSSMSELLQA